MGLFSGLIALKKVNSLRLGNPVYMSKAEIVMLTVNLSDAYKNLPTDKYNTIRAMFGLAQRNRTKMYISCLDDYYDIVKQVVLTFNDFAPFELYSGLSKSESAFLLKEFSEKDLFDGEIPSGLERFSDEEILLELERRKGSDGPHSSNGGFSFMNEQDKQEYFALQQLIETATATLEEAQQNLSGMTPEKLKFAYDNNLVSKDQYDELLEEIRRLSLIIETMPIQIESSKAKQSEILKKYQR